MTTETKPNTQVAKSEQAPMKLFFQRDDVKNKFTEIMGKNSSAYISAVMSVVNSNAKLKDATPQSVYMCALMAATLNLQVHPSLGQAYIIPYKNNSTGTTEAQFQIGNKGLKQLALRSGQFKTISEAVIYEGQLIEENPLTGFVFDFTKRKSEKIIGYASFFELLNGFKSTFYMSEEQITAHAKKYSRTYEYATSSWKTNKEGMALKTVTKLNINKYAPLSVEMQKAVIADQAVIKDAETLDVTYEDAGKAEITQEELQELYLSKNLKSTHPLYKDARRIIDTQEVESNAKLKIELEKLA